MLNPTRMYLLYTHNLLGSVLERILCLPTPEDKVMQRLNKMKCSAQRQEVTLTLHSSFYRAVVLRFYSSSNKRFLTLPLLLTPTFPKLRSSLQPLRTLL